MLWLIWEVRDADRRFEEMRKLLEDALARSAKILGESRK